MYHIITFDYEKGDYQTWHLPYEYHCIYILENGEFAYIGETRDLIERVKKHKKDPDKEKYKFKKIHIIIGPESDVTSAQHYEHLLILLMSGDNKFKIINDNSGYQKNIYARKNEYELYFDKVWTLLEKKHLVTKKDFTSIINSATYKYSPHNGLTEEQQEALTSIINAIDADDIHPIDKHHYSRPILITGEAGTGKTLVATSLLYYLKTNEKYKGKKIAMVISLNQMRKELQYIASRIPKLKQTDIISPSKLKNEKYDIIICDEAHKLRRQKNLYRYSNNFKKVNEKLGFHDTNDELDWILKQSNYQILFYDKKQCVSPTEIRDDYFQERMNNPLRGIRPIELKNQLRIKAGNDYVQYIYDLLTNQVTEKKIFSNYEFKLYENFKEMQKDIQEKNKKYGLSRLCTGYAWKWISQENNKKDICIDGISIQWNSKTVGWLRDETCANEMGSIYTLHGQDLNYVGVVIGPDLYYDPLDQQIKINKDHFFDNIVKRGSTKEELKKYIIDTYGVLLTRGIEGTYVYVCDKNLRTYLQNYMNTK